MLSLDFQARPALLFEPIGYERVGHLVPSLHYGFLILNRSFHLLCLTQFERSLEATATKNRHRDARSCHVLQRLDLQELPDINRLKPNCAVELNSRIKRGDSNTA